MEAVEAEAESLRLDVLGLGAAKAFLGPGLIAARSSRLLKVRRR
ncbi:hypothetical protein [Micromonospora sp. RTGN7]|nr:hypothetical protein [Micromonospora sp. RTGN7]